jgi:hypothetical protein
VSTLITCHGYPDTWQVGGRKTHKSYSGDRKTWRKGIQTLIKHVTILYPGLWVLQHNVSENRYGCKALHVLDTFFTSALDGSEWSASRPGCFTPEERAPSRSSRWNYYFKEKNLLLQLRIKQRFLGHSGPSLFAASTELETWLHGLCPVAKNSVIKPCLESELLKGCEDGVLLTGHVFRTSCIVSVWLQIQRFWCWF